MLICQEIALDILPSVSNRRCDEDRLSCTPRVGETVAPCRDLAIAPIIGSVEPSRILDLLPHSCVFIQSTGASSIAIIVF